MQLDMTRGSIAAHIRTLAVPAGIGFFFHTMFNVTDTWFAGNISTQALAALSLTFPIFFLIISVAGGMSEAITALLGNALGEANRAHAKVILIHAMLFALFLSVALTIAGLWSAPCLLHLLGAKGSYMDDARAYIDTVIYGIFFFVFVFFTNAMLNAVGDTKAFRNFLIGGFALNIVLDYWFVTGGLGVSPMGIGGIALATVIIEALGMAYLLLRLSRTSLLEELHMCKLDMKLFGSFLHHGLPPTMNMALMAMGIFIITYFVAPFGQEVVAAYGIGMRIEQIVLMPCIGLNVAVLAIVAQNNGSKSFDRIRETLLLSLKIGGLITLAGMAAVLGGAETFVRFFDANDAVIAEGSRYLRISAVALFGYVLIFICLALLQGIKRPGMLFYLSVLRQLLLPLLLFAIFGYFALGLLWYWWGITAIVWGSALFVLWHAMRMLRRVETDQIKPFYKE